MSHFTRIKTQIKDQDALVKALADMGFATVEVYASAQYLYGYEGDIRADQAEVIVRRQHIGKLSNDIGFKRQEDGAFAAIISEYDRTRYSERWLNQLTQRYAYHALMTKAPAEGFTVETEETLEDGTIRVVLGRWV
ncbi:DUF1257 domain-containing protein [Oscillatoria sp. FACHB-1407]|uniref:DUF1257 domain-containing protein n=1 Tax=Oscillatoria sp. FACHB-1407 TaxID=2692847 RepID=UPI00168A171C|nr:DUF1257 domain-containing protein [Oscillatoria sp. FACHB-1407]MBD2460250.1 DUF1257 domain-containing protein [Oscillatoria sp. FACHB-1407]